MFFDDYDKFLESGTVYVKPGRLNLRHQAIFEENKEVFSGARVLDVASHDGRWSFAALKSGASHVTGIEARAESVDPGLRVFKEYGTDPSTYDFIVGDIFDELTAPAFEVDVVMCLGFLYHTYRHTELFAKIRQLNPKYVIVDTTVDQHPEAILRLRRDNPEMPGQAAVDPYGHAGRTMVARPSAEAVRMLLDCYDFPVEHETDWAAMGAANPKVRGINDYKNGSRVTMRAKSR